MKNEFEQIETEEALKVHRGGEEWNKDQRYIRKEMPFAENLVYELLKKEDC